MIFPGMNFRIFIFIFFSVFFFSCKQESKIPADLIVHNAVVYTVDSSFSTQQAFAVKDGKFEFVGTDEEVLRSYDAKEIIDAKGKSVYPGFIDAHCHFYNYGLGLEEVDLVGTKSFDEVLQRLIKFNSAASNQNIDPRTKREAWIIGRGWDQNDWNDKNFPDRAKLDSLFPDRPVFLKRIDGHAALANIVALSLAGVSGKTEISGGIVDIRKQQRSKALSVKPDAELKKNFILGGDPSGILIDNAVELVEKVIPSPSSGQIRTALLNAQKNCFEAGLTTVDDAGLMKNAVDFIDSLQKKGELKMRVYAMLSDSAPNYDYYLNAGPYKTDRLNVCSFKFYGDGALGSRGACLKNDYTDKKGWKGFLLKDRLYYIKKYRETGNYSGRGKKRSWQFNVHAIGDSTVYCMIQLTSKGCINCGGDEFERLVDEPIKPAKENVRRNRIEHFQIVDQNDLGDLKFVIPSVQPTHATSDMYWAKDRLGEKRMKYAYAYKSLLKSAGIIALGTDFPVEDISPIKTFYAAVFRKDAKGFPEGGFQMEEALTREETIKGMTIWAAYANFEEKEKGSVEKGKFADFVMLDTDLMNASEREIPKTKVLSTFIGGEAVFKRR
jgi:predicted amidohydrolase YtcJ